VHFVNLKGYAPGEVVRATQRLSRFPHVFLNESSNRRVGNIGLKLDGKHGALVRSKSYGQFYIGFQAECSGVQVAVKTNSLKCHKPCVG